MSTWYEGNVGLILKGTLVPVNAWNATCEMCKARILYRRRQVLLQSQVTRVEA